MRFEPLPPLFEGAGWDRVAAAELEAERQRERKECSRLLERTTAGSWTSRDEGENDREAGEECVLFSSFLSSEWAAQSRGKEIAGVLRVARERERERERRKEKRDSASATEERSTSSGRRKKDSTREREREMEEICIYIYDGGKERVGEGVERRRSRGDAVVGVREEERSVSRTTKRAEKHKSQATGARHVVCIGEVRITGTRSLPKDGAKAPCYVYCP